MPTEILTNLNESQSHLWITCKQKKIMKTIEQNQSWQVIQTALLRGQFCWEWCCSTYRYPS